MVEPSARVGDGSARGGRQSAPPDEKNHLGGRGKSVVLATTEDMTRRIVCGGLAGMIAKTATAPLERMKMLSQTGEHGLSASARGGGSKGGGARPSSVVSLFRNIVHHEGVRGLWAGNGANLLRVFPAKGVVFASNDFYRRHLYRLVSPAGTDLNSTPPGYVSFFAGGLSGMSATAVTYPLDFARGRISGKLKLRDATAAPGAAAGGGGGGGGGNKLTPSAATAVASARAPPPQNAYHGIINTIAITVKEEGVLALYKGVTPTLLGAIPYEGIKFGTVGTLELFFPYHGEDKPPIWRKLCFGGAGGVMAGLLTYPNDTVRRMLQLQGSRGTTEVYSGYWDCVRRTYARYGVQRFYHGVGINLIRMGPNTAVQFGSYELLKRLTEGII